MSYGYYICIAELILVFRILYVYYRTYTCLTECILVLRNVYLYLKAHTGISDLTCILRNLYLSYRTCIGLTELILVFRSTYLYFGSYSCTKVPVGTISQNRSESYHIQGQIILIQKRTLVLRRYRSHQIHIPGL